MAKDHTLYTLRDYAITNTAVRVICPACGNERKFDPVSLAATHGYSAYFHKLEHLFNCTRCPPPAPGQPRLRPHFIPVLRPRRAEIEGSFAGAVNNIMEEL